MFLFQQGLQRGACIFNLMKESHRASYNQLMKEEGRSVFVIKQKEFMVTGFAAPDFDAEEFGATRIKDDAFYVYLVYEKTPESPFTPVNEAPEEGLIEWGEGGARVKPGDKPVTEQLEAAPIKDGHIVIDVSAQVATPKKVRRKGDRNTGSAAPKKGTKTKTKGDQKGPSPIADFTKKRTAKKVESATEKAANDILGELGEKVMASAKAIAKHMKQEVGTEGMRDYLRDRVLAEPLLAFKLMRDKLGNDRAKAVIFNTLCAIDKAKAVKFMHDVETENDPPKAKKKMPGKAPGKPPDPKGRKE